MQHYKLTAFYPIYSTHGLVHLVHARNIRTVGNISSLTEQQVQTLPIKTPKVESLKQALRNFQHQFVSSCIHVYTCTCMRVHIQCIVRL